MPQEKNLCLVEWSVLRFFFFFLFFFSHITSTPTDRSSQTAVRSSTNNFDQNEARREDNCDKSPSSCRFEMSAGWLCVRLKWENTGFCLKEKTADIAFEPCEGGGVWVSVVPHMHPNATYQQRFSLCYRIMGYLESKCYFYPLQIFRSFFSWNIQKKMMIVIAGLSWCFLQFRQTSVFRVLC